jgi:hypothetical protein
MIRPPPVALPAVCDEAGPSVCSVERVADGCGVPAAAALCGGMRSALSPIGEQPSLERGEGGEHVRGLFPDRCRRLEGAVKGEALVPRFGLIKPNQHGLSPSPTTAAMRFLVLPETAFVPRLCSLFYRVGKRATMRLRAEERAPSA